MEIYTNNNKESITDKKSKVAGYACQIYYKDLS